MRMGVIAGLRRSSRRLSVSSAVRDGEESPPPSLRDTSPTGVGEAEEVVGCGVFVCV